MTTQSPAKPDRTGASEPTSDADLQFVVCVVGDERYGIPVGRVQEIIRLTVITALPGVSSAFSGVINLRGRVIPVMDLRRGFGLPDAPPTRFSRIVIAEAGGTQIGLVVDAVHEVVRIPATAIEPTPALASSEADGYLTGVARTSDGLIVVLDLERLLGTGAGVPAEDIDPEASA